MRGLRTIMLSAGALMLLPLQAMAQDSGDVAIDCLTGNCTNGTGTLEIYEGGWDAGEKHGQGTLTYADGRIFSGTYAADAPVFGTLQLPGQPPRPVRVDGEAFVWADE